MPNAFHPKVEPTEIAAYLRQPNVLIVVSLYTMSISSDWTIKHSLLRLMVKSSGWWSVSGSNRRPPACKAGALPAELTPHIFPKDFGGSRRT